MFLFFQLQIISFVSDVHESPHDNVNYGVFILHFFCIYWIKCILLHNLNIMNIIAYFRPKTRKLKMYVFSRYIFSLL
ncbi:Uncharacterized protein FWK35_00005545 [Aphis craccivora]|uniref:Uncharacterized protein n=1 Tax=Aphis craccivora TaxID=307492 RepID=A0A6G0Z8A7_APHCR|nr:Uncharacterized protein FWK35_00005545 [Aphis craccivora]